MRQNEKNKIDILEKDVNSIKNDLNEIKSLLRSIANEPDDIKLNSLTKNFEYTKHSRELDALTDIEEVRHVAKCYAKLI